VISSRRAIDHKGRKGLANKRPQPDVIGGTGPEHPDQVMAGHRGGRLLDIPRETLHPRAETVPSGEGLCTAQVQLGAIVPLQDPTHPRYRATEPGRKTRRAA
jgi:hypothetical protein